MDQIACVRVSLRGDAVNSAIDGDAIKIFLQLWCRIVHCSSVLHFLHT